MKSKQPHSYMIEIITEFHDKIEMPKQMLILVEKKQNALW